MFACFLVKQEILTEFFSQNGFFVMFSPFIFIFFLSFKITFYKIHLFNGYTKTLLLKMSQNKMRRVSLQFKY